MDFIQLKIKSQGNGEGGCNGDCVWRNDQCVGTEASEYVKEVRKKYVKDQTTGLWMIPVSEKICKASKGFVCKVSLYGRDVNDYDNVGNGDNDDDDDWSDIVWIKMLKVN